jgi:hypothetical protein
LRTAIASTVITSLCVLAVKLENKLLGGYIKPLYRRSQENIKESIGACEKMVEEIQRVKGVQKVKIRNGWLPKYRNETKLNKKF